MCQFLGCFLSGEESTCRMFQLFCIPTAMPSAPFPMPPIPMQRVVVRRCLQYPISALPSSQRIVEAYEEWDVMIIQRWWRSFRQQSRPRSTPTSASKLLQCTFTSLRMVLRRWWSRDLFGCHYSKRFEDIRPIDFRMRGSIHHS